MKTIPLTAVLAVILLSVGCNRSQTLEPTAVSIEEDPARYVAQAYGIDEWDKVERIAFNFNVGSPDDPQTRQWVWWPKTGKVELTHFDGSEVSYTREPGKSYEGEAAAADSAFINDTYWLLMPFQLVWSDAEVTFEGDVPQDGLQQVTASYPEEGGYTPGDAYELFINNRGLIERWNFVRNDHSSPMTWDAHRRLGPVIVSTEHRSPEGQLQLWFDGLEIETTDGETHQPEPIEIQPEGSAS